MFVLKLYLHIASCYCTNTFRHLIFIISIGNIHKCMCRIIKFPCFIWAYNAGTIISDVAMHFEPCHGLIRPYIFLFNSLMGTWNMLRKCLRWQSWHHDVNLMLRSAAVVTPSSPCMSMTTCYPLSFCPSLTTKCKRNYICMTATAFEQGLYCQPCLSNM